MPTATKMITMSVGVMLLGAAATAGTPTVDWTFTDPIAPDSDGGLVVVGDGAGGAYAVGATRLFAGSEDIFVVRIDENGDEVWRRTFNGVVANSYDFPVDAEVDADGNLYVTAQTGTDNQTLSSNWLTMRFNAADGFIPWEQRYSGPGTFGGPIPRDMAMSPLGLIAVAGWSRDDDTWVDFGVAVYSLAGGELWTGTFSSPGFEADSAEGVAFGPDGSVVAVGQYATSNGKVIGVAKWSTTGAPQWNRTFDASSFFNLEDNARSVVVDGDGNVYVAGDGVNNSTDGRDFVLLKYAADGTPVWNRRFIAPTSDIVPTVKIGVDGSIIMSGPSNGGHRLVAYSPAGEFLWTQTYNGAVENDLVRDHMNIDPQGNICVLLRTVFTPGVATFTLVRYDASGAFLDATSVDPEGVTRTPAGFRVDDEGRYFATGYWINGGQRDMIAYRLLAPASGIIGDVNGDCIVDFADLNIVLSEYGQTGMGLAGDINGDGTVGFDDLNALLGNYGQSC